MDAGHHPVLWLNHVVYLVFQRGQCTGGRRHPQVTGGLSPCEPKATMPAEKYVMLIYGHGGGWDSYNDYVREAPATGLARGHRGTVPV